MDLRLEYADALRDNHRVAEARAQYEQALKINDALPATEIQRLAADKVAYVKDQLARLRQK